MLPSTKSELKRYIRRKLGGDFVPLELSDDNIDDVISEAIVFFQQNFYGFSTDLLVTIPIDANKKDTNGKPLGNILQYKLPENVFSVTQILSGSSFGNNGYWGDKTVPNDETQMVLSMYRNNSLFNYNYVDVELMQQNASMVQTQFLKRSEWEFNHHTSTLLLYSHANDYINGITCLCSVFADMDNTGGIKTKYFQEPKFLEYVELSTSEQIYNNLKKFGNNDLPGGMNVNVEAYQKTEELKELKEKIIYDYIDPTFYSIFGENDF